MVLGRCQGWPGRRRHATAPGGAALRKTLLRLGVLLRRHGAFPAANAFYAWAIPRINVSRACSRSCSKSYRRLFKPGSPLILVARWPERARRFSRVVNFAPINTASDRWCVWVMSISSSRSCSKHASNSMCRASKTASATLQSRQPLIADPVPSKKPDRQPGKHRHCSRPHPQRHASGCPRC